MATIKITLDKRRIKDDGTYPIYLRIIYLRKTISIRTGFQIKEEFWNEEAREVKKSYKNSKRINHRLKEKLIQAEKVILDKEEEIKEMKPNEIKKLVFKELYPEKEKTSINHEFGLFEFTDKIVDELNRSKKYNTAKTYKSDMNAFKKFRKNKEIPIKEVDYSFLKSFEAHCYERGLKVNGLAHYLKTLRSVLNRAIREGKMDESNYPFKHYRIKTEKTLKRAIRKEEFQKIRKHTLEYETDLWHTKNYILFMFNMQGMNFADMCHLTLENIHDDRLVYVRRKTKRIYNIKITDEAREILKYYVENMEEPNGFIFPLLPNNKHLSLKDLQKAYDTVLKRINGNCRIIGLICGIKQPLTTYVIRHSWATIGKRMGVPTNILQEALGHEDLATTETYLADFESSVIDEANERIAGG